MYAILIFHDGRNDYLKQTLESLEEKVKFPSEPYKVLIDDKPNDDKFIKWIKKRYKINKVVSNDAPLGIFGAVQQGWRLLPREAKYVWHQENDFIYNEEISISELTRVLQNKHIAQIALLRQPWYDPEIQKGGIYQHLGGFRNGNIAGVQVVLHRHYFTHNPCLYRRDITKQVDHYSEYTFVKTILSKNSNAWCAYLGSTSDSPKVTHIGEFKNDGSKSSL